MMWGSFFDRVYNLYFTTKLHSPEHIPNGRWHPLVKSLLHAVLLFLLLWIGAGPVCPVVTPVGCNGVCGDPVGCNGVGGDPVGCNGICGDPVGCNGVCGDPVGYNGVCGLKNQLPIVRTGSAEARVSMKKDTN